MDIGKPAATGGADLAGVLGQKLDAGKASEARGAREENRAPGSSGSGAAPAAVLVVSPEARERIQDLEALQVAAERYKELPAVRADAVAQARQRLASGYYDTDEVRAALTERLVSLMRRWPLSS